MYIIFLIYVVPYYLTYFLTHILTFYLICFPTFYPALYLAFHWAFSLAFNWAFYLALYHIIMIFYLALGILSDSFSLANILTFHAGHAGQACRPCGGMGMSCKNLETLTLRGKKTRAIDSFFHVSIDSYICIPIK